jgi:hypothetical protein
MICARGSWYNRRRLHSTNNMAQMGLQRGNDPLQLPELPQSGHLPEAQKRPVAHRGTVAHRFDQRQVLVHLIAPATAGRLHEHNKASNRHAVNYVSPLQVPAETPPLATQNPTSAAIPRHQTTANPPTPV